MVTYITDKFDTVGSYNLDSLEDWLMEFSQVLLGLFGLFALCNCNIKANCIVEDQKTKSNISCSFPFLFDNQIYYGCTTDFHSNLEAGKNIPACSTKTTSAYEHIEGE